MDLFKARRKAQAEYEAMLAAAGIDAQAAARRAEQRGFDRALFYPRHVVAGTAANTLAQLAPSAPASARRTPPAPHAVARPVRQGTAPAEGLTAAPQASAGVTFRNGAIPLVAIRGAAEER